MREIKFRAWDKVSKRMMLPEYSDWEDFMIEPDGTVSYTYEIGLYERNRIKKVVDYEIMQCVGLKDRDGKEIYHKDIIKCLPFGLYGVVEWIDELGLFTLQLIGNDNMDTSVYSRQIEGKNIMREVVGNVFENPELL